MELVYGFITKREFISTVQKHIQPGSFVLKIGRPFPGLYKDVSIRNIPEFYFLVLQEHYPSDSIIEISDNINLECKRGFNAVPGEIIVSGESYPVIRIKNIQEEDCIKELQTLYLDEGIDFSLDPVQIETCGMVKIIKYFELEEVDDGIYFDNMVSELGYFAIPNRIEWDVFEEMTNRLRVDVALGTFDAATGVFYRENREENIIRIFNPLRSIANLKLLKRQYLQEMCNPEFTDQEVS